MKETKAQQLSRKNAEIAVLYSRMNGAITKLNSVALNHPNIADTFGLTEVIDLLRSAVTQAQEMYNADIQPI